MHQSKHHMLTKFAPYCLIALLAVCAISGCDSAAPTTAKPSNTTSAKSVKIGVLLVSHGSRSKSWSKMLLDIEEAVRDDLSAGGRIDGVRSAFMEYIDPTIADQLKAFDAEGYTDVILVPLLLTVSSHSFDDIPTIIGRKEDRMTLETLKSEGIEVYKPKARVTIAPLLDFPEVLGNNVIRRTKQMSEDPGNEGVVLVAYGSEPYEEEWSELLDKVADEVRKATGVECVRRCWCGHIVRYKSEPTEKTIRKVLDEKKRALVIPVLVAVDENFQGKIIGGAIKSVGEDERVAYRHDAILPDENVNRWVIDISLELAEKIAAGSEKPSNAEGTACRDANSKH